MLLNPRKRKTVMFVDVSGSSGLYHHLGDVEAKKTIDELFARLAILRQKRKGHQVKTIGDELMLTFDSVTQAARFAIDAQRLVGQQQLQLRIGLDSGGVICDKGDVFGEVVNNAAHLTSLANGGQIMVSETIADELATRSEFRLRAFEQVFLKGQQQPQLVYRLFWQNNEQQHSETRFFTGSILKEINFQTCLEVRYGDRSWHLNLDEASFSIGRDRSNHLSIEFSRVSRRHCLIEYRNGRFTLEDFSTNGCWIEDNSRQVNFIRREEFPLFGSGKLALGMPFSEPGVPVIEFTQMD